MFHQLIAAGKLYDSQRFTSYTTISSGLLSSYLGGVTAIKLLLAAFSLTHTINFEIIKCVVSKIDDQVKKATSNACQAKK